MDTTAEVPEFKIARVGKDRKRRGAGVPWLGGGGNGSGLFAGATGGAGSGAAAGGLAGLLGKVAVLALIGTLSAGAWQVGKALRPEDTTGGAKPKLFADAGDNKYSDADLANVMRSNNGVMPNSLGYVSGTLDGMTPEERARKEAEAAEAARLAEEEAKKAEEEAAKQPADVAGAPAGMDPNALMKGVEGAAKDGEKTGTFAKKFGALSSSFGGLAGGSGMAGGVNRGFSNMDLNKGSGGKAAAMRSASKASIAKAAKARPGNSNTKGFAKRQLMNAQALSRQAASASRPESSAQAASQAFDNNGGAGNVITGPGVGTGSGAGVGDSGGSVNPGSSGGPVGGSDPYQQPSTPKSKNVTAWQGLIDAALILMAIIALMSIFAMIFHGKGWFEGIAQIFKGIMVALAAMVTLLGVAIMGMGQYLQGGILTAVGAFITVVAYTAPIKAGAGAKAIAGIAAKTLVASAIGLLAGSFGKGGPAAAS